MICEMVSFKKYAIVVSGLLLLVVQSFSTVNAADSQQQFDAGVVASKKGDYSTAVKAFESALAGGIDTPVLYYNLGVSYYRLEKYKESRNAFLKLTDDKKMAAIAAYNLGLVAAKQSNDKLAKQYFQQVIKSTTDKTLITLSETAIKRLDSDAKPVKKSEKRKRVEKNWNGYLSLTVANDSNVGLVNDDLEAVSQVSDTYLGLFAIAEGVVKGTRKEGYHLLALANFHNYMDQAVA